ncbi:MAG: DMT family transporter [Actinomycetes bacterium]
MKLEKYAPALFVLLWSTGFIVARYGTHDAGPFTFLAIRLLLAAVALWVIAIITKAPKLERIHIAPTVAVGICMHALYLGGVFFAVSQGLPSGVSALIAGLHPVLTSFVGNWVLKEKLRPLQWCGIGLGVLGVVAVLIDRRNAHSTGITALAITAMIISVIGMASGTVLQRARGRAMPLLRGTSLQYVAASAVMFVLAITNEHWRFHSTARVWFSLAWAVIVLSIAAVLIMMVLLSKHAAARVSSLFFLTPALSTIEGAVLFRERLGALAVLGLIIALCGVWLTMRAPQSVTPLAK